MSGIFGIIRAPGAPVLESELAAMADTLKHRGPDGIYYSARDNAGLGHCMLQSTPESLHETLPFRDDASGLTITADARIDNREQLLADIPVRPASGQIISDSQLILRAYMKWGEGCVDHLLGDFVFAVWDERKGSLFVARDHMGCKPFYYYCGRGLLVFASSANAVARVPQVAATVNDGRIADYLIDMEGLDKTGTWYREISRLPPAHSAAYCGGSFKPQQYWELQPADVCHYKTDAEYLEAFTEIYTEAVRARLRCHQRPASMLSGGLDSSTVVALARDLLLTAGRPPLRVYSGVSEAGSHCAETRAVRAVVSQGNLESTQLSPLGSDSCLDLYIDSLKNIEDPFDSNWALVSLMFLLAGRDGSRMMLTGVDGEHAVGAPTSYISELLRRWQWRDAWHESQGFSRHYYRGAYSPTGVYLRALKSRLTPDFLRLAKMNSLAALRYRGYLKAYSIDPQFAARADLRRRLSRRDRSRRFNPQKGMQAWYKHIMEVPYLTVGIERWERQGSYAGVEPRHPLLDIRLLKFSADLPLFQKVHGGWSKVLLRRLASERLASSVAWREGFEQLGYMFSMRVAERIIDDRSIVTTPSSQLLGFCLSQDPQDVITPGYFSSSRGEGWEKYWSYWRHDWLCNWLEKLD